MLLFLSCGCSSIHYYSQAIGGQFDVIRKSRDIDKVLLDKNTPQALKYRLATVKQIREFSVNALGLPGNKSYLDYADIGREYVVWNVFAADEFSVKPRQWCFLFVGCLQYRGYFSKKDALEYINTLETRGLDTYLGGVRAYSTLGWFDDPVLNTMLKWTDARLAAVIIHELTHQFIYIKNDTEFNESLADAIARIGAKKWLESTGRFDELRAYENYLARESVFVALIIKYKKLLDDLYSSNLSINLMRSEKNMLLNELKHEYKLIQQSWDKDYYGDWLDNNLNNAGIASVISYRKYLPAFLKLYANSKNDIIRFYTRVKRLSKLTRSEREDFLLGQVKRPLIKSPAWDRGRRTEGGGRSYLFVP